MKKIPVKKPKDRDTIDLHETKLNRDIMDKDDPTKVRYPAGTIFYEAELDGRLRSVVLNRITEFNWISGELRQTNRFSLSAFYDDDETPSTSE